jgi:hypothetical protein
MHDIEGGTPERKPFGIGLEKCKPRSVLPRLVRLDIDRDDFVHALAQERGHTTVSTARVEHRLVPAKEVAELVDAPQPVAKLPERHAWHRNCTQRLLDVAVRAQGACVGGDLHGHQGYLLTRCAFVKTR